MFKKGCSPEKSSCEGFVGRMKNEMFYGRKWNNISIEKFIVLINEYNVWYKKNETKVKLSKTKRVQTTTGS